MFLLHWGEHFAWKHLVSGRVCCEQFSTVQYSTPYVWSYWYVVVWIRSRQMREQVPGYLIVLVPGTLVWVEEISFVNGCTDKILLYRYRTDDCLVRSRSNVTAASYKYLRKSNGTGTTGSMFNAARGAAWFETCKSKKVSNPHLEIYVKFSKYSTSTRY